MTGPTEGEEKPSLSGRRKMAAEERRDPGAEMVRAANLNALSSRARSRLGDVFGPR